MTPPQMKITFDSGDNSPTEVEISGDALDFVKRFVLPQLLGMDSCRLSGRVAEEHECLVTAFREAIVGQSPL